MVEDVVHLDSQLEIDAFADVRILGKLEVPIVAARATEKVTGSIPDSSERLKGKGIRIGSALAAEPESSSTGSMRGAGLYVLIGPTTFGTSGQAKSEKLAWHTNERN